MLKVVVSLEIGKWLKAGDCSEVGDGLQESDSLIGMKIAEDSCVVEAASDVLDVASTLDKCDDGGMSEPLEDVTIPDVEEYSVTEGPDAEPCPEDAPALDVALAKDEVQTGLLVAEETLSEDGVEADVSAALLGPGNNVTMAEVSAIDDAETDDVPALICVEAWLVAVELEGLAVRTAVLDVEIAAEEVISETCEDAALDVDAKPKDAVLSTEEAGADPVGSSVEGVETAEVTNDGADDAICDDGAGVEIGGAGVDAKEEVLDCDSETAAEEVGIADGTISLEEEGGLSVADSEGVTDAEGATEIKPCEDELDGAIGIPGADDEREGAGTAALDCDIPGAPSPPPHDA